LGALALDLLCRKESIGWMMGAEALVLGTQHALNKNAGRRQSNGIHVAILRLGFPCCFNPIAQQKTIMKHPLAVARAIEPTFQSIT